MKFSLINNEESVSAAGLSLSVIIHAVIFLSAALLLNVKIENKKLDAGYLKIITEQTPVHVNAAKPIDKEYEETPAAAPKEQESVMGKPVSKPEESVSAYMEFNPANADTADLEQVYSESTLNVSLKYPAGWKYVDQNVNQKLDGVTFWAVSGKYSPPPYVHLEVKEKYLFNPSRYKHKIKMPYYTIYYNDPVELSGQVSQILYIRTESDEDFSLKLIMEGKEAFKSFQPEFFGMIRSFKFGRRLF